MMCMITAASPVRVARGPPWAQQYTSWPVGYGTLAESPAANNFNFSATLHWSKSF